jgi:peptidoglycan/LPS O-acetylase OafA/YrhL
MTNVFLNFKSTKLKQDNMIQKVNLKLNVQWLRGFSVLAVLLFHMDSNFFPNGYLGVDIFFVISGYVMLPQLLQFINAKNTWRQKLVKFYIRRILRLAPAFLIITLSCAILFFLFAPISDHNRIFGQYLSSLFLLGNLGAYKFGNNYFHPQPNPFLHLWSLSVEEQIYLILPLVLIFLSFTGVRKLQKPYFLMLFFSGLCHVIFLNNKNILEYFGIQDITGFMYYAVSLHSAEFFVGGLLCLHQFHPRKIDSKFFKTIFILLGYILFFYRVPTNIFFYFFVSAWILVFFIIFADSEIKLPLAKQFVWLGDRSYSIYLWHLPLFYLLKSTQIFDFLPQFFKPICALLTIFLVSNFSYLKIENTFRVRNQTNLSLKERKFKVVTLLYILSVIFSLVFWNVGGNSFTVRENQQPKRAWLVDSNCYVLGANLCAYPVHGSNKKVLLIGDSHAGAIARSFIEVAHKNSYSAYIFSWGGCPTISKSRMKNIEIDSPKFLERIFSKPKIIPWCPQYLEEVQNILITQKFDILFISNDCSWCNDSVLTANALTAVDLSKFVNMSFFIGQTPVFKNPLSFNPSIFGSPGPKTPIRKLDMNQTSFYQDNFIPRILSNNLKYISTSDIYCFQNFCHSFLENSFLFVDYNHLSIEGAKLIEPKLQKAFQAYNYANKK